MRALLFLPLVLLISSSAHRGEVCVLVVALCGFPCSTHPKQPAPTQQPDVIAAPVKEQLLLHIMNHVFKKNVWIRFLLLKRNGGNYLDMINCLKHVFIHKSL